MGFSSPCELPFLKVVWTGRLTFKNFEHLGPFHFSYAFLLSVAE
jgi:hypothetical protein